MIGAFGKHNHGRVVDVGAGVRRAIACYQAGDRARVVVAGHETAAAQATTDAIAAHTHQAFMPVPPTSRTLSAPRPSRRHRQRRIDWRRIRTCHPRA